MAKVEKDPVREDRIDDEIMVDAYGPEERAVSWYIHLDDQLRFPFQARCKATKVASPLRKGEIVEVYSMAPDDSCDQDMLVMVRWQGRKLAAPLSQLDPVNPNEATAEAVGDWHYWVSQGYLF